MSARDLLILLGLAGVGALFASAVGAAVLHRLRRRPIRTQAIAIAGFAMLSALVGTLLAAKAMFISTHDLKALLVVLLASSAVGFGAAVQFGGGLARNAADVRALAQQLGDGEAVVAVTRRSPELAALADEVTELPRRLEELHRKATALERSRRELVAWVSHDLRSPLATIRAMAEALDDEVVTDAATTGRYHHQIRRDAERLSALVDDLFELSRIHSGLRVAPCAQVALKDVVEEAIASQLARAGRQGVRLRGEVDDSVVVEVATADFARVLHNVLDNAIRHTPSGGDVVVRATTAEGHATVSIEDQCGGIPAPDLERVFDVAFRGDTARTKNEQGGGLGLAIAKGLVETWEGQIEVDNVHAGCRFTVRLPLPS